jgi:hypothetical protein
MFPQKSLASAKAVAPARNKLTALPMQREVSGTALVERTVIFVSESMAACSRKPSQLICSIGKPVVRSGHAEDDHRLAIVAVEVR